jgi:hypothetical protein
MRVRSAKSAVLSCWLAINAGSALAEPTPLPQLGGPHPPLVDGDRWYFQTSAATVHFNANPEHNNWQQLLNIEWQSAKHWVLGGAYFRNSFGQPSQYVYGGRIWHPSERMPSLHLKLTGGLIHGYKDEYQNNIPFNDLGIAPALLPAIGLSKRRFATEVVVFGTRGLMWNVGFFISEK